MKHINFFVVILISISAIAFAKDKDCSVGFGEYGELHPLLVSDKGLYKSLTQKTIKKNSVKEIATLKDGTKVSITQSGCTHHLTLVEFVSLSGAPNKGSLVPNVANLLELLPHKPDGHISLISSELKKALEENPELGKAFKCGAGFCTIEKEGQKISVLYDFAV